LIDRSHSASLPGSRELAHPRFGGIEKRRITFANAVNRPFAGNQRARRRSRILRGVVSTAVILAGGRGSRLAPYTAVIPKPLLPVGDRAILEIVLRQLQAAGIANVVIAVGHLAHLVEAVLGDGTQHGLRIRYHVEEQPLGTAGALALLDGLDDTFLMMNGDVLTDLDYTALVRAHQEAGNAFTIATHRRTVAIDYGILHTSGTAGHTETVSGYEEKPTFSYLVSMGVYVLEPATIRHVPAQVHYDVPDLVQTLLDTGEPVGSFEHGGYWLDIGRHDDYDQAVREADTVLPRLLGRLD
jgi:NDP-mannose synthase